MTMSGIKLTVGVMRTGEWVSCEARTRSLLYVQESR